MFSRELTFTEASAKVDAYRQLGVEIVYLKDSASDLPWDRVTGIEAGGAWRMSIPTGARIFAKINGVSFSWLVDFEDRGADGAGQHLFNRERLREIALKLPVEQRPALSKLLRDVVLPPVIERTREIRAALNRQWDSEACIQGVIAFIDEAMTAEARAA